MACLPDKPARGFTLIEMIVVIVITGIVASFIALFIRKPVDAYFDSAARADLTDVADTALRFMSRDIRLALPNSVRVATNGSVQYIEFMPTKTGARYYGEEEIATGDTTTLPLSFTDSSKHSFTVAGPAVLTGAQQIINGDYVVVYNLGSSASDAPANAYYFNTCVAASNQYCNIAQVSGVAGNVITLSSNPFAQQVSPQFPSPTHHFQVTAGPVSYVCDPTAGTLSRYANYAIATTQPTTTAAFGSTPFSLLANNIYACNFDYQNLPTAGNLQMQHNGLVGLSLTMKSNNESVTLFREVHVDNTP